MKRYVFDTLLFYLLGEKGIEVPDPQEDLEKFEKVVGELGKDEIEKLKEAFFSISPTFFCEKYQLKKYTTRNYFWKFQGFFLPNKRNLQLRYLFWFLPWERFVPKKFLLPGAELLGCSYTHLSELLKPYHLFGILNVRAEDRKYYWEVKKKRLEDIFPEVNQFVGFDLTFLNLNPQERLKLLRGYAILFKKGKNYFQTFCFEKNLSYPFSRKFSSRPQRDGFLLFTSVKDLKEYLKEKTLFDLSSEGN